MTNQDTRRPIRICSVETVGGFVVRLGLTNGTAKTVDLGPFLRGPIFEPIRSDPKQFGAVTVDPRAGTIVWPNGADIDPDVLCQGLAPCWDAIPQSSTQPETLPSR